MLQDKKGKKGHQQIAGKIKRNSRPEWTTLKACYPDQKIARVSDARIAEKAFEVGLRHRGEIAIDQRQRGEDGEDDQKLGFDAGMTKNGSRTRRSTTKPAALDATERKAVIGVGAP